jgi:hypothetical protein
MQGQAPQIPLHPLIEYAKRCLDKPEPTDDEIARLFGTTRRSVQRWKSKDSISIWRADQVLTRLHSHIDLVYEEEYA